MDYILIVVLLMISSICSATETAFSSCNHIRLKNFAQSGDKNAKRALEITENFDKALTCILIGNNVVNIASSAIATVLFTEKFGAGSVGIATVVMTILVLVFGEIIPKSLAKENAESFSLIMAKPLSVAMIILTPLIAVFMAIKHLATKIVGSGDNSPSVTEEELKYIIDEIEDEGVLEEQESDLVRSALEFDETSISEILVPRINVVAVELGADLETIRKVFFDNKYSRLPVYDKTIDNIVGILLQSDFYEMYLEGQKKSVADIMTKPIFLSEMSLISESLHEMQKQKAHMAVVVDQYGGTEGICTLEDILEELVGEIYDERDEEDTSFVRLGKNRFEVSAELSVNDFLERMELPEDLIKTDRNSMGGWVMELLEKVPEPNEFVSYPPFNMSVIMEDEQRIDRLKIRLVEPILQESDEDEK